MSTEPVAYVLSRVFLAMIAVLLPACSSPASTDNVGVTASPSPKSAATIVASSLPATLVPTSESTAVPKTPTQPAATQFSTCVDLAGLSPFHPTGEDGVILLSSVNASSTGLSVVAFSSATPYMNTALDGTSAVAVVDFVVSPSGKRVAFVRSFLDGRGTTASELMLFGPGLQTNSTIAWDRVHWHRLVGWTLDEQHVLVSPDFDSTQLPTVRPDALIRLSLEDGVEEVLEPTMPYSGGALFDYWRDIGSSALYNSTMTHVVYLDGESSLVVWDQIRSAVVWSWEYEGVMADLPRPIWSANGDRLVVTTRPSSSSNSQPEYQFASIDLSGQVVRSPILEHAANSEASNLGLSPDGRYLAFLSSDARSSRLELRIWDIDTNVVTTTCIVDPLSAPVWSPDSRKVMVSISAGTDGSEEDNTSETAIILDVTTGSATSFDVGTFLPLAWIR